MGVHEQSWIFYVTILEIVTSVYSISRGDLFPFGPSARDQLLEQGNDKTHKLTLDLPVLFYDGSFSEIYINTNGFIATAEPPIESTYLGTMPTVFGMIAVLHGDLDTSDGAGKVYFRQDSSGAVLRKAADYISGAFPLDDEVNPTQALVVTWVDVATNAPEPSRGDDVNKKRNTFQLVIASLKMSSYAILLYPRDEIHYTSTAVGGSSVVMHAGFSKGMVTGFFYIKTQGPYYRITTEDETSIRELPEKTNSGVRGVWVYEIGTSPHFTNVAAGEVPDLPTEEPQQRVSDGDVDPERPADNGEQQLEYPPYESDGQILIKQFQPEFQPQHPEVVVVEDGDINVDVFSYNLGTCANSRNKCNQFADCRDYSTGSCCHCRPGYYGNGIHCVAEAKPQRMNGKVDGSVFVGDSSSQVVFGRNDLHSYVVVNDGRSYVAISDIPDSLGPSLQPLSALGGVIGWAFALEQPGFKNGFSIIGGEFTRNAEVTFQPGNEKLKIKQEFKGIDEHDHLLVSTVLNGRIPEVPQGSTVQIGRYTEIYQYNNNLVTSSSTRQYVISLPDGTTETKTYQWHQNITYQGCQHDPSRTVRDIQMLTVDQVFVMYDASGQLIRYAMSNKIGDVNGGDQEENACFTGRHGCDNNAACRPGQGTQFTCECAPGFNGDGRTCYDIDECRENSNICGSNAICNNQPGTFRCECVDGYQFASDGQTCIEVNRPVDHCDAGSHNCDVPERALCSYTGASEYICSCLPGFIGDGRVCQDIDECQAGRCHQEAVCYNTQGSFTCQCRPGYYGDGFYCSSEKHKTQCETQRDTLVRDTPWGPRAPTGQFIPQCDDHGAYVPTQCHGSTGHCWCVDHNGQEISGTRSGLGQRPMCIDFNGGQPPVGPTPRPFVHPLPPGTNLMFSQSGHIEYVPLEGNDMKKEDAKVVLHLPEKVIIGVAYDCVNKMVYWTDITTPSISKASLQGGEPILVITSDISTPEGIAIDHLGQTMFWTDSGNDRIEVASLDGSQRRVIVNSDLVNPRSIIADAPNGNLYWTDWNRDAPRIETAYMDGSNRRVLVKDDIGLPNALTYDAQSSLLCWADAGTHRLECMKPGQGDRRKLAEGITYPFGMIAYGKNLYYTDWNRDAVIAVDRYSGKETDSFQPQKRSKLYGITTAYAQCPAGQNYCAVNNGGCTHLCLATPTGRSCLCPDNPTGVPCVERRVSK